MDTVTQVLLGASIGEAAFGRKLGKKALVFGGLCGLFPDLDILADWVDPWAQFTFHRSVTHSVLVLPFLALLFGWLAWRAWGRKGKAWTWIHLAFWALVTHPLLDICTAYGTQLFWPLSHRRISLDGVASIDFFYSIPLALVVLLGLFKRGRPKTRKKWAWIALGSTTAYLALGVYRPFPPRRKQEGSWRRPVSAPSKSAPPPRCSISSSVGSRPGTTGETSALVITPSSLPVPSGGPAWTFPPTPW